MGGLRLPTHPLPVGRFHGLPGPGLSRTFKNNIKKGHDLKVPKKRPGQIPNTSKTETKKQEKLPLLLISDTCKLISLWEEKYNIGKRVPNIVSHKLNESGIHKLKKKDIIKTKNISKIEINFECIRDFILMLNSRILIGDEVSLYSNMALLAKSINIQLIEFK